MVPLFSSIPVAFLKKLSVCVLATGLILTTTGCVASEELPQAYAAEDSETSKATEVDVEITKAGVAESYETFLAEFKNIDMVAVNEMFNVLATNQPFKELTTEGKLAVVALMLETVPALEMVYAEKLTIDEKYETYNALILTAYLTYSPEPLISIPEEAVLINKTTATVDLAYVVMSARGDKTLDKPLGKHVVTFIYHEGQWLYQPVDS